MDEAVRREEVEVVGVGWVKDLHQVEGVEVVETNWRKRTDGII